jgi:hypothetical protein
MECPSGFVFDRGHFAGANKMELMRALPVEQATYAWFNGWGRSE